MPPVPAALQRRHRGFMKRVGIPRIDWSHPLAQGLEFYGFDAGGTILDLVKNLPVTFPCTNGAVASKPSIFGQSFKYDGVSGTAAFAATARIQAVTATPPYSWACAMVDNGSPDGAIPFCRTANNNASQPFINWCFQRTGGVWAASVNSGGSFTALTGFGTPANGVFQSMLGVAASASVARFFFNGARAGADTTGLTIQSSNTSQQDSICFDGNSSAAAAAINPFTGWVPYGAFWSRALSAVEALELHFDPYCFLIFPEDNVRSLLARVTLLFPYLPRNVTLRRR